MNNVIERCSCGAREKNKCSKESEYGGGKMCLKEQGITIMDANIALDMLDNPPTPNGELIKLLELK